jgi:DNA gyrase/topoisomerase IV subunit B
MAKKKYTEQDITVLEWREAVRLRPAMYLGSTGIQGFVHLLKDFFASFHNYKDTSNFYPDLPKIILDAERFFFEITNKQSGIFRLENCKNSFSSNISETLHLQGFDFAILNSLSQYYEFTLLDKDKNHVIKQTYQQGILQSGIVDEKVYAGETLEIKFTLDSTIWKDFEINPHFIAEIIQELAFLNKDKTFELIYSMNKEACRTICHFENGLRDLIDIKGLNGIGRTIFASELEYQSEDYSADICFSFWDYSVNESFFKSFANNCYTHEGGTHKKALILGISKALKKYVKENNPKEFFVINERTILSCLIGAIHLKIKEPSYYGSTKNRLSNQEIIKPISDFIFEYVYKKLKSDEETAKSVIRHFYEVHWNRKWLKRF